LDKNWWSYSGLKLNLLVKSKNQPGLGEIPDAPEYFNLDHADNGT